MPVSEREIDERVAFLRRFKNALVRQRQRFQHFLDLLERGAQADENPDEALEFHIAVEEAVVRDIAIFERTIAPLEALYESHGDSDDPEIPQIRAALRRTRNEVVQRAQVNKDRLKAQIEAVAAVATNHQVDSSSGAFRVRAFTSEHDAAPALVDVRA